MTDNIDVLVAELLDEKRFHQDEILMGKIARAVNALERQQAVVEAARGYGRGEFGWPRRLEKALAALDAQTEGDGA